MDLWDNDQYISDEESRPGVAPRTRRIQLRHDYFTGQGQRQDYNLRDNPQDLSTLDRAVRQDLEEQQRQALLRNQQQAEDNPGVYDILSDDDYGPDLIPALIDDNLELPLHLGSTQSQQVSPRAMVRRRRATSIIDTYIHRKSSRRE